MPEWLTLLFEPERLLTVAVILFIVWLICRSAFKAFPFIASFVELVQTLVGDKDNPGIAHRMEAQSDKLREMGTLLETVRAQVQNSHNTNLRDDVDAVGRSVDSVTRKLDEHIEIAKDSEKRQDETARQVERLASKWADD